MGWLVRFLKWGVRLLGLAAGVAILLLALEEWPAGGESLRSRLDWHRPPPGSRGRIGILVGHLGYDSGATCPSGLREVEVNRQVAGLVADKLAARGYGVERLEEFDERLKGYSGKVLVALHADSCVPGLSGFKAAHAADSAIPAEEDRLVECLAQEYQKATGLALHEGSITPDMRHYHAFYAIRPETPAAIVELGFLNDDARILVKRPERAAEGIVRGILCFLEPAP